MAFILKAFDVDVFGFPRAQYYASSMGRARARAFAAYSTSFTNCTFRRFLQISRVRKGEPPAGFGDRLTVGGKPAYRAGPVEPNSGRVLFVREDSDLILASHPLDVLVVKE